MPSVLLYLLPFPQTLFGLIVLLIVCSILFLGVRKVSPYIYLTIVIILLCSFPAAFYWQNPSVLVSSGYIVLSLLLIGISNLRELVCSVEIATDLLIIMGALSCLSIVYYLNGGQPFFEISSYVGQPVQFYIGSFALKVYEGSSTLMRPSAIFDEPGAFAFFIVLCASCRMFLSLDNIKTWSLLLLGFCTISLAHTICFVCLIVGSFLFRNSFSFHFKLTSTRFLILFSLLLLLILFRAQVFVVFSTIGDRLYFDPSTRRLAGDSRSVDFFNLLDILTPTIFAYGYGGNCFISASACAELPVGGGNFLLPIFTRGFFATVFYYVYMLYTFIKVYSFRFSYVYLAVLLMFLQRPYVMSNGYSLWAILFLLIPFKIHNHRYSSL